MSSEHTQDATTLQFSDFCRVRAQEKGKIDNLNCTSRTQDYNTFRSDNGKYLIFFYGVPGRQEDVFSLTTFTVGWLRKGTAKRRRCPIIRGTLRRRL